MKLVKIRQPFAARPSHAQLRLDCFDNFGANAQGEQRSIG